MVALQSGLGSSFDGHPGFAWRDLLVTHGVTQVELATRTGTSKKHINQILQGHVLPSAVLVAKMAKVLDATRPADHQDGGRRTARLMWNIQSHWVLDAALAVLTDTVGDVMDEGAQMGDALDDDTPGQQR